MQLDLYLPRTGAGPAPVVLMFHGGGWIEGSPKQARGDLAPFLAAGWAGVTPSYRLAPRNRAPAALEDAECALRWVGVHAAEYGLDRDRIVVAGHGLVAAMGVPCPERSISPAEATLLVNLSDIRQTVLIDQIEAELVVLTNELTITS